MRVKKLLFLMFFSLFLILSLCMASCKESLNIKEPGMDDTADSNDNTNENDVVTDKETNDNDSNSNESKVEEIVYAEEVIPVISVNSSTSVLYEISNVLDSITEYSLIVEDSIKNEVAKLNDLNSEIKDLESNKIYTMSGSYKGIKDNKVTIVNIKDAIFTTKDYMQLSLITKAQAIDNVYSNSFEIVTKPYVEKAPSGYQLGGFIVVDEAGNEKDVPYNGEDVLYVDGITPNTKYQINYYYDIIITNTVKLMSYDSNEATRLNTNSINNLEYRIRFVGFWIVSGSTKSNRVRMMYNGDVLYVYYVEDNDTIENPFSFILPTKYEDYTIVGAKTLPENVTQNMDCELIMYSSSEKDTYSVIFYDLYYRAYHIEKVAEGDAAVGPTATPEKAEYNDYYYEFDGWDVEYDDIRKTTHVKPKRKFVSKVAEEPHLYDFNIFISKKSFYAMYSKYSAGAIRAISSAIYYDNEVVNQAVIDIDLTKTYIFKIEMKYQTSSMIEPSYKTYEWTIDGSKIGVKDEDATMEITYTGYSKVKVKYENVDSKYAIMSECDEAFINPVKITASETEFSVTNDTEYKFSYAVNYDDNPEIYYVADEWETTTTKGAQDLGIQELTVQTNEGVIKIDVKSSNFEQFLETDNVLQFIIRLQVVENSSNIVDTFESIYFIEDDIEDQYYSARTSHIPNQDPSVTYELRPFMLEIYIDSLGEWITLHDMESISEDPIIVKFV